ncbi:MAG: hypothetical protein ABL949_11375 [Fimbriimonadaceae bacterium]
MPKQIYSESEISKILQTAAKIQEQESASAYSPGVTFEELQRIAAECGISEDALKLALTQPEQKSEESFMNLVETHERVFDGELDLDRLDEVVEALGPNVKLQFSQQLGRSMKARLTSGTVFGDLEISSRNGRTKLRFRQTPFVAYFAGLHGPLILSFVIGAGMMGKGYVWPGLMTVIALLTVGGLIFRTLAQGGKKKARKLVDEVSVAIQNCIASDLRKNLEGAKAIQSVEEVSDIANQLQ